jgi:hypothetical protein
MEYVLISNLFSILFYFSLRAKIKTTTTTIDTSIDPVRKNSVSSTDGQNSNLAPQLKIDASGALVVDEERFILINCLSFNIFI